MRGLAILGVLVLSTPAFADRTTSIAIGATFDARGTGASFGEAAKVPVRPLGGGRVTLAFEDAPVPIPQPGGIATGWRLAPELIAGFVADDARAEGFVGAGVRAELQIASYRHGRRIRGSLYTAARAEVIGAHRDGAAELALGECLWLHRSARICWEGGALVRPHDRDGARELDALSTMYVAWSR